MKQAVTTRLFDFAFAGRVKFQDEVLKDQDKVAPIRRFIVIHYNDVALVVLDTDTGKVGCIQITDLDDCSAEPVH
jgi:hypothetical protein